MTEGDGGISDAFVSELHGEGGRDIQYIAVRQPAECTRAELAAMVTRLREFAADLENDYLHESAEQIVREAGVNVETNYSEFEVEESDGE